MIGSHGGNLYGFMLYIYISYIYISYIYICTYVCSLYPISIDIHFPPVRFVQCESEFEESGNCINGKQRHHNYRWFISFFSCFFPLLFIQSNLTKKDAQDELVLCFFVRLLSFRCVMASGHVAATTRQPSPVHAGGVLSRLLSTCEFHRGNGRVEMCCGGVVASLDLMVVTNWVLTKGTRKGHKSLKKSSLLKCAAKAFIEVWNWAWI